MMVFAERYFALNEHSTNREIEDGRNQTNLELGKAESILTLRGYCGGASSGVWGRNPRLNKERKQDSKSEKSDNDRRPTKTTDRYILNQQIAIARIQTRNGRLIHPRPNSRTHPKHRDENIQLTNSQYSPY